MAINPSDQLHYVGVDFEIFDPTKYGQKQVGNNWCWAACMQMLMNYYGLEIDQHSVVRSTYGSYEDGSLPDLGADAQTINQKLNEKWQDVDGLLFKLNSQFSKGAPHPLVLINELIMKRPVIAGYDTGHSLHAVLVTAVGFEIASNGNPMVRKIVVRDPQPPPEFQDGRIEYPARDFANSMHYSWKVNMVFSK